MSRLIDADALRLDTICNMPQGMVRGSYLALVDNAPTIEAVPVVHGEWIKEENTWICSVCHKENACAYDEILHRFTDFFCPKCGADMRKGGAE